VASSRAPAAPHPTFACLWCGRSWSIRAPDDLEGYAQLCPDCLGKAGDNAFLRFRLRAALEARAAATTKPEATGPEATTEPEQTADLEVAAEREGAFDAAAPDDLVAYYEARASEYDDWYLRRGRYEHGPIHDAAWNAELDAAGRWLDGLPIQGRIVELAAGTGWWSPLLASKGELWMTDAAEAPLERARERLVAHRLRAHLHVRDAWAEPEGAPADALFAGFWLGHVERERTAAFFDLVARWLAPGGRVALIDSLPDPRSGAADHPAPSADRAVRRLDDGRAFTIVKVFRTSDEIAAALRAAGFTDVEVTTTGRFFVLATARRGVDRAARSGSK
jgi:demethylmenaquinone methyltransferase/2-methoxy-6-polyprenyl-1,4-benzoquinol methylase